MRPLPRDREAFRPGRLGRLRVFAPHSRLFWGLRLHLVTTTSGLPIVFALTNPKDDERHVIRDLLEGEPALLACRPGQILVADKGYASAEFETFVNAAGTKLIRPAKQNEKPRLSLPV